MARPSVFTKQTLQKLEEAFALDCTDEEACLYADIAPSSLYSYQEAHQEFLERKRLLHQKPVLAARQCLIRGIKNDSRLALMYLERKKRNEFGRHEEITLETRGRRLPVGVIDPEVQELIELFKKDTQTSQKG